MSKKKNKTNSSIKCEVESCKYNNCEDGCCELDEIKVGCTCDNDDCKNTSETVCESFENNEEEYSSDDFDDTEERITDTTYEVEAESDEDIDDEVDIDDEEKEDE